MWAALLGIAAWLEKWARRLGWWAAWLNVALMGVILVQVTLRYAVSGGHQIVLGELEWHLYAAALMFGLSYSQTYDAHVRVDALSGRWSARTRSMIEVVGIVGLMYPFLGIMIVQGVDYVAVAWRVNESSNSPVGLPWRWLIKAVIPAAFSLLALTLTARLLREAAFLAGAAEAVGARKEGGGGG